MVHITSLTLSFDSQVIFDQFSLDVARNEKVVLSGESGCGKSTLLKAMTGMVQPQDGLIHIAGHPLIPENLVAIRKETFYLPQDILPQGDETVKDYLEYPFGFAVNRGRVFPSETCSALMDELRLARTILNQPLQKLSGGERKRIGVILGLLLDRSLYLLDEPTAGVDTENAARIDRLLMTRTDATVIAVSHDGTLMAGGRRVVLPGKQKGNG